MKRISLPITIEVDDTAAARAAVRRLLDAMADAVVADGARSARVALDFPRRAPRRTRPELTQGCALLVTAPFLLAAGAAHGLAALVNAAVCRSTRFDSLPFRRSLAAYVEGANQAAEGLLSAEGL